MSVYIKKSNENIECAKYLYKSKKYYPSIIHSSYYSAFQLSKHIIIDVFDRTETSLEEEQDNFNYGVHELYNKIIFKELTERDENSALEFNKNWNLLKKYRIDSDYKAVEFDVFKYGLIIKITENLIKELKLKFNI